MSSAKRNATGRDGGDRRPVAAVEPRRRVGPDFEQEYPGASALATECYANLIHAGDLLMDLHNRQSREEHGLSQTARQVLAIVDGAGEPLEPSVIAERVLVTTGSMTSLLDTLEKRGLVERLPHPADRRKLLIAITPDAQAILDELLPSLHEREREVIGSALTRAQQRELLTLLARVQDAALRARDESPTHTSRRRRGAAPSGS